MAIVFGTSFQDNIKRVYSNTRSNTSGLENDGQKSRSFTEILAQLDGKTETKLTIQNPAVETLTNLTTNLLTGESTLISANEPPVIDALIKTTEPKASEISVKATEIPVKNLSPVVYTQTSATDPNIAAKAQPEAAQTPPFPAPTIVLPNGMPAATGFSEAELKKMLDKVVTTPSQPTDNKLSKLTPNTKTSATGWDMETLKQMITESGKRHGVDPLLGMAVAKAESSFQTDAVSSDGFYSKGMFQILDSTAKTLLEEHDLDEEYDPFNPHHSSHLGMGYLRKLLDTFSKPTDVTSSLTSVPAKTAADLEKLAVAAFNTGEGNVTRAQMVAQQFGKDPSEFEAVKKYLPDTTQTYVERVIQYKKNL